jgi:hypothetical protein
MRTSILRVLALAVGLCWCVVAVADDPPPDKLQRKSRTPETKKADPAEKTKTPDKDTDKPGEEPKRLKRHDEDTDPVEDPEKLKEQIAKDMQSAEQKLKAYDPGSETQSLQDRVIKNLDKLLELARNPPPSDQQQQQQQSKGQTGKQKSGQKQGQMSRRQERMQRRSQQLARNQQRGQMPQGQQDQDQQNQDQQANRANPRFGGGINSGKADRMSDIVKDIWGHLPETLRQEVDHYYRDQFMPRYRDLLQQYYSRLAEQERRARDGK